MTAACRRRWIDFLAITPGTSYGVLPHRLSVSCIFTLNRICEVDELEVARFGRLHLRDLLSERLSGRSVLEFGRFITATIDGNFRSIALACGKEH